MRRACRLFRNDREASFAGRPNRFTIIAESGGETLCCHCPNPGRLLEFTFPGEILILEKSPPSPPRKTAWTAVAFRRGGTAAPICASRANQAAAELILPEIIPGMVSLRPEFRMGSSRFDFLAEDRHGTKHIIEVKCCSLVEYGTAMFPDAASSRALKHLEELAELSGAGYVCHILFVIMHGNPARFVPNLHTDPAFASALSRYGTTGGPGKVLLHAALLRSGPDGETRLADANIPVDLSFGELAEKNRGSYLIVLELPEARRVEFASSVAWHFEKGWYVYSGSAMKNLEQRVARHLRKGGKKNHWHIDRLVPFSARREAYPVRSYRNIECDLARELKAIGGVPVPRFGCSDCSCSASGNSHLHHFTSPPAQNRAFVDLILKYRHIPLAWGRIERVL